MLCWDAHPKGPTDRGQHHDSNRLIGAILRLIDKNTIQKFSPATNLSLLRMIYSQQWTLDTLGFVDGVEIAAGALTSKQSRLLHDSISRGKNKFARLSCPSVWMTDDVLPRCAQGMPPSNAISDPVQHTYTKIARGKMPLPITIFFRNCNQLTSMQRSGLYGSGRAVVSPRQILF